MAVGNLRSALFASVAVYAAAAATPAQAQTRNFNVPAQRALTGIPEFARQADIQILVSESATRDRNTRAVRGTMSVADGLRLLLAGTGLRISSSDGRTFTLAGTAEADRSGEAQAGGAAADSESADAGATPEILVVGSRSLNTDIRRSENEGLPYNVFDRTDIDRSGASNVGEFIARNLTTATNIISPGAIPNDQLGSVSRVSLRGLSSSETLILVDGRRVPSFVAAVGNEQQPDLNGIPIDSIERIEVLPSSASGIYGGNATGGVINIVLRRDYRGLQAQVTYGNTTDLEAFNRRIDISGGVALENGRTHLTFSGSYSDSGNLTANERPFSREGRAALLRNNPDAISSSPFPPSGATTNIRSVTGGPLTLDAVYGGTSLGSNRTHIPLNYLGAGSDFGAALMQNAGSYNLGLADTVDQGLKSLAFVPTIFGLNVNLRRDMTGWLSLFVDGTISVNRARSNWSQLAPNITIPASSPTNPFNQNVRVTFPLYGLDEISNRSSLETQRVIVGAVLDLPGDWRGGIDALVGRTTYEFEGGNSLTSTAPLIDGRVNVFADDPSNRYDLMPFIARRSFDPTHTRLINITGRAGGSLPIRLPGGSARLSSSAEFRSVVLGDQIQTLSNGSQGLSPRKSQTVFGAYAEVNAPLLENLDLLLALRFDQYATEGAVGSVPLDGNGNPVTPIIRETNRFSSVNPTVAVTFEPLRGVRLRASYGTGFLPANPSQIVSGEYGPVDLSGSFAGGLIDPVTNQPLGVVDVRTGGNPGLRPERSETFSAGVIFSPPGLRGLRLSVDWTRLTKTDAIVSPFALSQLDLDRLAQFAPERIQRASGPNSPIVSIDGTLLNFARQEIEAIDASLSYEHETARAGTFRLATRATWLRSNQLQIAPEAPSEQLANTSESVDLQATASFTWEYNGLVASWFTRYFDGRYIYRNRAVDPNNLSDRFPSYTSHDVFLSYELPSNSFTGSGTTIRMGINNIFSRRPAPDLSNGINFRMIDSIGDPRLANWYVSIRKMF